MKNKLQNYLYYLFESNNLINGINLLGFVILKCFMQETMTDKDNIIWIIFIVVYIIFHIFDTLRIQIMNERIDKLEYCLGHVIGDIYNFDNENKPSDKK